MKVNEHPAHSQPSDLDYLVLDACTRMISVGVLGLNGWKGLARAGGDALERIFDLTRSALREAGGGGLGSLGGVLFCRGPGSLLGLRLAAMAVSTWKTLPGLEHWQLRQYHALEWMAAALVLRRKHDFHLLSPFRRELLNHLRVESGRAADPGLLSIADLNDEKGTLYFMGNGTLQVDVPEGAEALDYSLEMLPEVFRACPELFPIVLQPELAVPQAPVFAQWSAQRHRGPSGA